jgi:hypothetical protein
VNRNAFNIDFDPWHVHKSKISSFNSEEHRMLKTRCKVFSVSLARAALLTSQALIVSICVLHWVMGVDSFLSRAHAQSAARNREDYRDHRFARSSGGELESLRPFDHTDLSNLETCDRALVRMELEQKATRADSRRIVEQSGP